MIKINNNNSENVKSIIEDSDKSTRINECINGDINKQQEDFKKKLEEKRRKTLLSTSDVMDQVNILVIIYKRDFLISFIGNNLFNYFRKTKEI